MGIMKSIKFLLLFILIPIFGLSQNPNIKNESDINIKFIEHNVKRKQTLFTISNLYNVPIDLIKKYNPQIKGDKISKRMVLKIPFITRSDTEKVIKETLAKQVSKSKNKKLNLFDSVPNKKNISLAFIAPFNLDKIDVDSIENAKKYLEKLNLSTLSLDFYSGTLSALETAKKLGIKIKLDTYDNKNSFEEIDRISNIKKIKNYDFIIGPFIPRNINKLSSNLQGLDVPIISPLTSNEIELNENVFQSIPSKRLQRELMFSYVDSLIVKDPDPCVMIIYDSSSEKQKVKLLERFPYAELIDTDLSEGLVDPEITDSLLVTKKNNFVFLESQNLNVITSVSSMLNSQISNERNIKMLTSYRSEIYENENISLQHLGNLKFTYPTYFLPKFGEELSELNNEFLANFGKLPNKTAIRAYEITLDLILRTSYRRKLIKSIDLPETKYYQNRFKYQTFENGFINNSVLLIQHDDLDVFEIDLK